MKYIIFVLMISVLSFSVFFGLGKYRTKYNYDCCKIINNQLDGGWKMFDVKGSPDEYEYEYYMELSSGTASVLGAHWSIEGKLYEKQYKIPLGKEMKIFIFQKKNGDKYCLIFERYIKKVEYEP